MDTKADDMLIVIVIGVFLSIIGVATDTVTVNDMVIGLILIGGIGAAVLFTKKSTIKDRMSSMSGSNASGINYTYSEGKQVLNDWAEENFTGKLNRKTGVRIDQTRSESEPTAVVSDPNSGDFIFLRHYYVTHGDKNKPMDFFVDVTNGEYYAHKQVNEKRRTAKNLNPFEKLDVYRKTKHFIRKARLNDEDKVDPSDLPQGIPVGTFNMNQGGGGGE